jgi:PAS domain S-box-containing protein
MADQRTATIDDSTRAPALETSSAPRERSQPPATAETKPRVTRKPKPPEHKITHDTRVLLIALMAGFPGVLVSMILLWGGDFTAKVEWTVTVFIVGVWLGCSYALRERVVFPLQTLSNLLAALREGDFSIRARGARYDDPLGEAMLEVNQLGSILRAQRLGALEATALLRAVMAEIDVAVFTFDGDQRLRLVNRAGERLMAQPAERLLGRMASELGLAECLAGEQAQTIQQSFPGSSGRWEMHRSTFRESGEPHQLLVISDVSRALREEERQAWQRLVRVLGHELNNSMAPIKSIAGSLEFLFSREPLPHDWREDAKRGLGVIAARAESLTRFLQAYSRLAKLPLPHLAPVRIADLMARVTGLETRIKINLIAGPDLVVAADGDQLEQLLINLLRNAVDAAMETGGGVTATWRQQHRREMEISIEDEGPGLQNTANLFVPFFTTKQGGSGIGLVLSRQIAEAHGGALTLENRKSTHGCVARLRLPV